MKRNDYSEVKKMDIKTLVAKVKSLKKDLQQLQIDRSMQKLTDLKGAAKKRCDLAQVLTALRQKELILFLTKQEIKDAQ